MIGASVVAFGVLYVPLTHLGLLSDDAHWIWTAASSDWREFFFVPERFHSMAPNFTPFLGVVFKVDWLIFKFNVKGYVWHNLTILLLTAGMLFLLMRFFTSIRASLAAVLLFLLSPTTYVVGCWLASRHYLEGLMWALASLYLCLLGARQKRYAWLAGLAYGLAALFKEIFVILPAMAFVLVPGRLTRRAQVTLPLWLGLSVYSAWRLWIMGGLGGYSTNKPLSLATVPELVGQLPKAVALHFAWGGFWILLAALVTFVTAGSFRRTVVGLVVFAVLLIPLLPIVNLLADPDFYGGRYLFHLAVAFICGLVVAVERLWLDRHPLRWLAATSLVLTTFGFLRQDAYLVPTIATQRGVVARSMAEFLDGKKRFVVPEQPIYFYEALRKIHLKLHGTTLHTQLVPPPELLKYADPQRLQEIVASGIVLPTQEIAQLRAGLLFEPITVHLSVAGRRLDWRFGPDEQAAYRVLYGSTCGLYTGTEPFAARGTRVFPAEPRESPADHLFVKVVCTRLDGREVVSPEFSLWLPGQQVIDFAGLGGPASRPGAAVGSAVVGDPSSVGKAE